MTASAQLQTANNFAITRYPKGTGLLVPARAMFWEMWRLHRNSAAIRLSAALAAGLLFLGIMQPLLPADELVGRRGLHFFLFWCIGGAAMYGHPGNRMVNFPGFPLYLGYARPVPSWLLVTTPLVFLLCLSALTYLLPAIFLSLFFELDFLLSPLILMPLFYTLISASASWWTASGLARFIGIYLFAVVPVVAIAAYFQFGMVGPDANNSFQDWTRQGFALSLPIYLVLLLLGGALGGLCHWGVARQRRGDHLNEGSDLGALLRSLGSLRWMADLFRLSCPTFSPTWAELWREMKTRGAPMLVLAFIAAGLLFLSPWFAQTSLGVFIFFPLAGIALALLNLASSTFTGVNPSGRVNTSIFDATRALSSGRLAAIKLSATLLSLLGTCVIIWFGIWLNANASDQAGSGEFIASISAINFLKFLILIPQLIALLVALGTLKVLGLLHSRKLMFGVIGLMLYIGLLVGLVASGWGSAAFLMVRLTPVLVMLLLITLGLYLYYRTLQDRMLNLWHVLLGLLVYLGYLIFCLAIFQGEGLPQFQSAGGLLLSVGDLLKDPRMFSLLLLPFIAIPMAPWAIGLLRHR